MLLRQADLWSLHQTPILTCLLPVSTQSSDARAPLSCQRLLPGTRSPWCSAPVGPPHSQALPEGLGTPCPLPVGHFPGSWCVWTLLLHRHLFKCHLLSEASPRPGPRYWPHPSLYSLGHWNVFKNTSLSEIILFIVCFISLENRRAKAGRPCLLYQLNPQFSELPASFTWISDLYLLSSEWMGGWVDDWLAVRKLGHNWVIATTP